VTYGEITGSCSDERSLLGCAAKENIAGCAGLGSHCVYNAAINVNITRSGCLHEELLAVHRGGVYITDSLARCKEAAIDLLKACVAGAAIADMHFTDIAKFYKASAC